jgi:hypothetical protein
MASRRAYGSYRGTDVSASSSSTAARSSNGATTSTNHRKGRLANSPAEARELVNAIRQFAGRWRSPTR